MGFKSSASVLIMVSMTMAWLLASWLTGISLPAGAAVLPTDTPVRDPLCMYLCMNRAASWPWRFPDPGEVLRLMVGLHLNHLLAGE